MCVYSRRDSLIFFILIIDYLLIDRATTALINYADILENQLIDDQLRLLGPESLLKNSRRFFIHNNGYLNDTCARDLAIYKHAIDHRESWALKMLDASSKLPVGILQGHVIDMGMFDECIEVNHLQIHGRHCMYTIDSNLKKRFILNPTLSICLPSSCNANDVVNLLYETINSTQKLQLLGINIISASCSVVTTNYTPWTWSFLISFTIAIAYITFLIICTICDLLNRRQFKIPTFGKSLVRLSLLKSAEVIFNTKTQQDSNLPVIHGIRVISTCWIVLVHEYLIQLLGVNVNAVYITQWFSSWGSMYPLIGLYSVDTFLALSGFLMTYNFFKHNLATDFNILLYYLHRFIRLTLPVVALTVATYVLLPSLGGSGARYEWLQNIFVTSCASKWWSVLFYFQNFLETDNYCLLHLWSLSVDMQLYWLSPLVLYPLYKRPKFGLTFLFILILASAICSGAIVGIHGYSSIYFSHDYNITRAMEAFQNVYQMTYTRASPWLIGILFAYIITHKSIIPNKYLITFGWLMAIASFLFCTLCARSFTQANYEYNLTREVMFATLQRPLWAFGICWIIYASINNAAGPIANLLSAKIFLPISRLSYSIYLVHIVLPLFQVGIARTPRYFHQYSIFQSYISDMILAIVAAFFFCIIFEMPIIIVEDILLRKRRRPIKEKLQKIN